MKRSISIFLVSMLVAAVVTAGVRNIVRRTFSGSGLYTVTATAPAFPGLTSVDMTFADGPVSTSFTLWYEYAGVKHTLVSTSTSSVTTLVYYFPNPYFLREGGIVTWSNSAADAAVITLHLEN